MRVITLEYGNETSDRHRWKWTTPVALSWPSTPPDFTVPTTGVPSGSLTFLEFVTYWFWQNIYLHSRDIYHATALYSQSLDITTGVVSPARETYQLGSGWQGTSSYATAVGQSGGYHSFTLYDSSGRQNRQYTFGSNYSHYPRKTVDATLLSTVYECMLGFGLVSSWKKSSAGGLPGNGLLPYTNVSQYLSCGYNRRQRLHNVA